MLNKRIIYLLIIVAISLISGCSKTNYDSFAQCLTDEGMVMYGTEWCSHCKAQKELFGESFGYVNYVDCDLKEDECVEAGITGFPTWVIDGELYPGKQSIERLHYLTDCEV